MVFGFDRQGWITVFAALLLALITLFTSYDHVDLLGTASFDIPQQAGIPCLAAAVATAIAEAQLASNDRRRRGVLRAGAENAARREANVANRERSLASRERSLASRERYRADQERILAGEERNRADQERERAARRAQQQARCNRVQLCHQLDPNEANAQRVRDVISLLDEYGGLA